MLVDVLEKRERWLRTARGAIASVSPTADAALVHHNTLRG